MTNSRRSQTCGKDTVTEPMCMKRKKLQPSAMATFAGRILRRARRAQDSPHARDTSLILPQRQDRGRETVEACQHRSREHEHDGQCQVGRSQENRCGLSKNSPNLIKIGGRPGLRAFESLSPAHRSHSSRLSFWPVLRSRVCIPAPHKYGHRWRHLPA